MLFRSARWTLARWQGRIMTVPGSRTATIACGAYGVVAIAFFVLRNTPWGSWLAP